MDGSPIRNLFRFAKLLADTDLRRLRKTLVDTDKGVIEVSTMFMCIDASGHGPPLLWESMISGGPRKYHGRAWKYADRLSAHDGHSALLFILRTELDQRGWVVNSEKEET